MHITQCHDAAPELLRRLLQKVIGVTFVRSSHSTIRNPPLGTVGGAGDPQSVTEHTFKLQGLPSTDLLEEVKGSRRFPLVWRLEGRYENKIPVLGWRVSRYEQIVIILAQPDSEMPLTLTASLQGGQTFTWPIQTATP